MANAHVIPFNHEPAGVDYGNTGRSYTCPAGKYARVTITITASVKGALYVTGAAIGVDNCVADSNSTSISVWVKAGDTVSVAASAASSSGALPVSSTGYVTGKSSTTASVNSSTVSIVDAEVRLSYITGISGGDHTIDGDSDGHFHVEEYNILT